MKEIRIDSKDVFKIMREDNLKRLTDIKNELEDSLKNNSFPPFITKETVQNLLSKAKEDLDKLNGTNTSNTK